MNIKKSYERILYRRNPIKALKKKGLKVGKNFAMMPGVFIDQGHTSHIEIGDDVTLAPRAMIFSHDASTAKSLKATKIAKTIIGNNVYIGAAAIILPDVHIGDNTIIGAGSVVTKDIPSNVVCAGNPAKILMTMEEFKLKRLKEMENNPKFPKKNKSNNTREIDRIGYVI